MVNIIWRPLKVLYNPGNSLYKSIDITMLEGFKASVGQTQIPGFSEEPACAKFCPNISYKQVYNE